MNTFYQTTARALLLFVALCFLAAATLSAQIPVDLNTWSQQGPASNGVWDVSTDGSSVVQRINGNPTFFVSPETFLNTTIRGSFGVETTGDDDYIGFVFGYQSPNAINGDDAGDFEFFLFDWKQGTQSFGGGLANEGFNLVSVNEQLPSDINPHYWAHEDDPPGFDVLATDYGENRGWEDNVAYDFELVYNEDRITISIEGGSGPFATGQTIFDITPAEAGLTSFPEGRFGFYNYSQDPVRYAGFTLNNDPVAENDEAATPEDAPVTIDVLANDSDPDPGQTLSVSSIPSGPSNGAVVVNADNTITYTPASAFTGADAFTYAVSDGAGGTDTASVAVTVGQPAVAVAFEANIAGHNEVVPVAGSPLADLFPEDVLRPTTVQTTGAGDLTATLEGTTLTVTGSFSNLSADYAASHIHPAVAGVNGPVAVALSPTVDADQRGGAFDETVTLDAEQVAALQAGALYVNVHTADHPGGEIRGQLLPAPNSAPAPVTDASADEGFSLDFTNEGAPSSTSFQMLWSDVEDPEGNRVIYQVEAAADAAFEQIIDGVLTIDDGSVETRFFITAGVLDVVLEQLGVEVDESFTFYLRANSSDGSLRAVGQTLASTVTRGVVGEPVADGTPPVCGPVTPLLNAGGQLEAVETFAIDAESGIASARFTTLRNLQGFLDDGSGQTGPYAEDDQVSFDASATERVDIRGERIDFQQGGVILTEITNGAGLSATCDPVIESLTADVPPQFRLEGSYPNPFSGRVQIAFETAEQSHVVLEVYDVLGRRVATLVDEELPPRSYRVSWDGKSAGGSVLPSGLYLYRLRAGSHTATGQMTLVK